MWSLDRFSAHSTPAASGRSSPAPRRSLQVQRPGLAPRSSSLSLLSNPSSSNLPTAARTSVTSGLKNQIYAAAPEDVEDPLVAFERLIASTLHTIRVPENGRQDDEKNMEKPVDVVETIDFGEKSLEDFLKDDATGETQQPQEASDEKSPFAYSSISVAQCASHTLKAPLVQCL